MSNQHPIHITSEDQLVNEQRYLVRLSGDENEFAWAIMIWHNGIMWEEIDHPDSLRLWWDYLQDHCLGLVFALPTDYVT